MDYEKKYNEALKRARELRDKALAYNANHYVKDYETIFPELRESEDERIRKGLLKIFKQSQNGYWAGMEIKDIVSYLEKQEEPKPDIEICPHSIKSKSYSIIGYPCEWSEDERIRKKIIEHFKSKTKDTWCNMPVKSILDWLEKQKEQKPAEWSEEDKRRIDAICELLENTSAIHPNYSHRKLIIWLKSLRPSWKPSEEQMRALESCFYEFGEGYPDEDGLRSLYNDLKKL